MPKIHRFSGKKVKSTVIEIKNVLAFWLIYRIAHDFNDGSRFPNKLNRNKVFSLKSRKTVSVLVRYGSRLNEKLASNR